MGQRKEIVRRYVSEGLRVSDAVLVAGIKRSTYYYCSNGRPKGKRPSQDTKKLNGEVVSNQQMVNKIIEKISPEYNDYGYQTVSKLLQREGYIINHKKVYRLMRDHDLLHPRRAKSCRRYIAAHHRATPNLRKTP